MKKFLSLMFIVLAVAACKDDDSPSLTVEQRLAASSNGWVFESIIINDADDGDVDVFQDPDAYAECEKDDAVIFTSDGKYSVKTNTKCEESDPDVQDTGIWTLNADKTQLTITSTTDGPILVLTALSVDDTNIKGVTTSFAGFPIAAKITMKKK